MAKAIERYFNVALFLLVLSGFGTLASTGGLDLPAVLLVGLALALRGYQFLTGHEFVIPERWTTVLTLVYVAIYLADYFFLSRSFLTATVHLVLFAMVVRLFSLQRTRDHYMLAVLSFLMVLAAAVLTVGSVFLFSFAGWLPAGCGHHFCADGDAAFRRRRANARTRSSAVLCRRYPPSPAHGLRPAGHRSGAHADDSGRKFFYLLPAPPHFVTLPERLRSGQRCLHWLHRSCATGPHRTDPAVQHCRHAHRNPKRSRRRIRPEVARGRAEQF